MCAVLDLSGLNESARTKQNITDAPTCNVIEVMR
jgi:hypothetical protein